MWWCNGARVSTCTATTSSRPSASRAPVVAEGISRPNLQRDARWARGARRLPVGLRGHACRDGSDRRGLKDRIPGARGLLRVVALEPAPLAQRPRPQDRRQGFRVDLPARAARTRAAQLRAAAGDPPAPRSDQAAQGTDQRARPLDSAAREGAPRRGHQALQRRIDHVLEVRASDARSAAGRGHRPRAARRALQGQDAPKDPAATRGSRAGSRSTTTGSWSRSYAPTSTHWTPRSRTSASGSPRCSPPPATGRAAVHDPCVQTHAAQVLIAECGLDMALFPTVGHFASSAGGVPGPSRIGRPPAFGTNPPRTPLADRRADRVCEGRRAHQWPTRVFTGQPRRWNPERLPRPKPPVTGTAPVPRTPSAESSRRWEPWLAGVAVRAKDRPHGIRTETGLAAEDRSRW
jgi:hypothetical protein